MQNQNLTNLQRTRRLYYEQNKEKIRQQQKEYRERNKEKCQLLQKAWREANKEIVRSYQRKENLKDPIKTQARKNAYKRRLKSQMPPWADKDKILTFYQKAKQLGLTVDHIIPLQGDLVSGLHVENNLQLLSLEENSAKLNRFIIS